MNRGKIFAEQPIFARTDGRKKGNHLWALPFSGGEKEGDRVGEGESRFREMGRKKKGGKATDPETKLSAILSYEKKERWSSSARLSRP